MGFGTVVEMESRPKTHMMGISELFDISEGRGGEGRGGTRLAGGFGFLLRMMGGFF